MPTKKDFIDLNADFLIEHFEEKHLRQMFKRPFENTTSNLIEKQSIELALKKIKEMNGKTEAFNALDRKIDTICLENN